MAPSETGGEESPAAAAAPDRTIAKRLRNNLRMVLILLQVEKKQTNLACHFLAFDRRQECIAGTILPIGRRKGLHQILFTWTKLRIARRCESQRDSRMRHSHNPRQTSASHESRERAAYDRRAALSELSDTRVGARIDITGYASGRRSRSKQRTSTRTEELN